MSDALACSIFLIPIKDEQYAYHAIDPDNWRPHRKGRPVFRPVKDPKPARRVAGG